MKEIKISNSNFKFIKLNEYVKGLNYILVRKELKRSIFYQRIFFTNIDNEIKDFNKTFKSINLSNISGNIYIPKNISDNFDSAWVVVKEKGKKFETFEYSVDEIRTIISFAGSSSFNYISLTESLLLSTRCKDLIDDFYQTYGISRFGEFNKYLGSLLIDFDKNVTNLNFYSKSIELPSIYSRSNQYSVVSLLEDLVKDKSYILIDEDILGKKYNKISTSYNYLISEKPEILNDGWGKVEYILGNKTRANLSINMTQNIKISVPKNDLGIGDSIEVPWSRSYCIIKDGFLWQRRLAVRVSEKLKNKLKRYKGLVYNELLKSNELLLDLSKLPIISRSRIGGHSLHYLSELAVKEKLSSIAIEYLNFISPDKKMSDKEKFLSDLGIVDGKFLPNKIEEKYSKEYYSDAILSNIVELSIDRSTREYIYSNIKSSSAKGDLIKYYKIIYDFLNKYVIPEESSKSVEDIKKYWEKEYRRLNSTYRDQIFKLIMSKNLRFDNRFPKKRGDKFLIGSGSEYSYVKIKNIDKDLRVDWKIRQIKIKYKPEN